MRSQRALAACALVLGLGGLGAASRDAPVEGDAVFASLGSPTMPFVPLGSFITSSWFCPGVPAAGVGDAAGSGGSVSITNPSDAAMNGRITVFSSEPGVSAVEQPVNVLPRSNTVVDLDALQPAGAFRSAVVEIDGGGGFVEQTAAHPDGNAVAACSNSASSNWYFADGFTADDSTEQLIITNPYPGYAAVDIGFVTGTGPRNPVRLQGYPVPGRSVQVVELVGARDEPVLATRVTATRGRVMVGRAQHYLGGGRSGYTMNLGAPSLSSQYWFADGETGPEVSEQFSVFNGSAEDVTVSLVFLGIPIDAPFLNDTEIEVPANRVVAIDTADIEGLPDGRHGAVLSTLGEEAIVVERVLTRPAGDGIATTVVMGSPPELAATRWSSSVGSDLAIDNVLVVLNADGTDAVVTISTLGPGGLVPVAGLTDLPLAAGAVITVPFTDPSMLGRPFVVESDRRVYVERLLPRGGNLRGRSGSFALAG